MSRPQLRYTPTAIGLHWLMAALLVGLVCVGVYMHGLPLSPWKLRVFSWHKWAGVSAFLLVIARLGWRATHRPPGLPAPMTPAARVVAQLGHGVIYVLLFAIPVSGWLMSSAKGFPTVYFGVLPLPDLVAKNKELGETLLHVHQALNVALAVLVAGHSAAALKHHFIDRDDVLTRMLPSRRA
ncbi:MAG: cytochrome b [Steroidobacterales bacterium]